MFGKRAGETPAGPKAAPPPAPVKTTLPTRLTVRTKKARANSANSRSRDFRQNRRKNSPATP